ncbi:DUF2783 domain-containing protein [Burkholderia cenocepacia]|uniref:DUF2783 domain-containing protein n=1 Tax=Burkholderia cepacia complex TaxID=87882 RepID=UPI000F56B4E5|nr:MULTISPECIES: DUF2783 domain-containing protein [Burkholderia cepacia complex]ELW9446280.1 DUF2783 domain-containing protein [Burkholderia cenocepacia]MBR8482171.1 DUF2783 domain-containing protein [Burkholderia cenocepacia]MDN7470764.1 DUF2783 domain-containing protein [Burkholderia orbicola]MDN7503958.1 DUF2783 domain-containing protein [Burkholderia orbicola]RQU11729.1 DUF2783 domain-containing protein [Burkholderia cenocepacia]
MPPLDTRPRLADPDAFYEALIDMHRDLSDADSQLVNAKLILLLANQVGDADVLREAMALARQGATSPVHPAAEVAR